MTDEQVEAAALALVKIRGWSPIGEPDVTGKQMTALARQMARAAIEAYEAVKEIADTPAYERGWNGALEWVKNGRPTSLTSGTHATVSDYSDAIKPGISNTYKDSFNDD